MNELAYPRPLDTREREVLDYLLAADFPGVETLRSQAEFVVVTDGCTCGCATIDLFVDPNSAPPAATTAIIPVEAETREKSVDKTFSVLLFVQEGWLALLEIVYYGEQIPTEFPPATSFEPPTIRAR